MRFTVITPTLNAATTISDCIRSVKSQQRVDIEHIVVDGGSTDKTVELSKGDAKVIVAPETSIYEALNIGIEAASGDIICFLNSDDQYFDDQTLCAVADAFKSDDADVIYGLCNYVDSAGRKLYTHHPTKSAPKWFWRLRCFNISHPATFFRVGVIRQFQGYDTKYRFISDCDLIVRMVEANVRMKFVPSIFANFTRHEMNASSSPQAKAEGRAFAFSSGIHKVVAVQLQKFLLAMMFARDPRYFVYFLKGLVG